ncbi:hypothetical protein MNEG_12326 [Monoraphidium neglectum]|uniref:Uncharacterized protein n=1 Tax=Monoraphidium neglectum TaxID=145388 RepID=A0A0D2MLB7_9CHLO|nr:hypothetical protein MNEG_12326 [Monoraphidium neglectum]KIY95635.1 hypothetical protein MNEG_12326 [Monoraphidium neglectum]|eukprot:XP_013894655.1 hypothetical protein MNEG_12326 [Monoraphidium neglectum]
MDSSRSERAGAALAPAPRPIDTTRILNLFGYVGPVASLMTHTLFSHSYSGGGAAAAAPAPPRAASQALRSLADGRARARAPSDGGVGTGGRTRFVLSRTEDAIDSVLPCAAERMFKRPGKFGNPGGLRFTYDA